MYSEKDFIINLASNGVEICDDSRKVTPGSIFIAVNGASSNGSDYIVQSIARGADYIVCDEAGAKHFEPLYPKCKFAVWQDTREAAWRLAQSRYKTNESSLKIIGITGTNGKTTSAYLLEYLFNSQGLSTGVMGTISYRWPGFVKAAPLTTPGPLELHSMLKRMRDDQVQYAVMEVSSHALSQKRVGGINFSGALFTNLTQDHLDFHKDFESYFKAKASLFLDLPFADKPAAINIDDPYGARLAKMLPNAVTYGFTSQAHNKNSLKGEIICANMSGLHLRMRFGDFVWEVKSPLVGSFNACNLLGVQALAIQLGFQPEQFASMEKFHGVCGRLEKIPNNKNLNIFVDYAHTPDALINVQQALKNAGFKRLLVVFGCGGNRDRGKRPLMGEAVASLADIAILTSDNPRFEDPLQIIEDVKPGLKNAAKVIIEPDRKKATALALELLAREDALLIAGKGHEDYQIINGNKLHYSDQETVREILEC